MSDYVICENYDSLLCENERCAHKIKHPYSPTCCHTNCMIYKAYAVRQGMYRPAMVARCIGYYSPIILPKELFEI